MPQLLHLDGRPQTWDELHARLADYMRRGAVRIVPLRRPEAVMPKCNRCGAPTLLGFVDGDKPILCAPCEQVLAEEREPVR